MNGMWMFDYWRLIEHHCVLENSWRNVEVREEDQAVNEAQPVVS